MKKKLFAVVIALSVTCVGMARAPAVKGRSGKIAKTAREIPGMRCSVKGTTTECIGVAGGGDNDEGMYAAESVIYIPQIFNASKPYQIILHFHGHVYDSIGSLIDPTSAMGFAFYDYLAKSGRNAILIIPFGAGNHSSDASQLLRFFSKPDRVAAYLTGIQNLMKIQKLPSHYVMTAHSGGYHVLGSLLKGCPNSGCSDIRKKIREVYLFDALYGKESSFLHFLVRVKDAYFVNVSIDSGASENPFDEITGDLIQPNNNTGLASRNLFGKLHERGVADLKQITLTQAIQVNNLLFQVTKGKSFLDAAYLKGKKSGHYDTLRDMFSALLYKNKKSQSRWR